MFKLRPILTEIKELYQKPISSNRFQEYLSKLQGDNKNDLALPISGFNPMAKEHILQKIEELQNLEAETLMNTVIEEYNSQLTDSHKQITVVLNIADDLKGAWTNFYTTDFDSKFKLNPLVKRNFCVPYFWTSEGYTKELIRNRTLEYLNRTQFRLQNANPKTLEQHVEQEIYALKNSVDKKTFTNTNFEYIEAHFLKHRNSEEYDLIFNFFYGKIGSQNLGYKTYGINDKTGFDYAKIVTLKRKST